jgi:hypothetical protein
MNFNNKILNRFLLIIICLLILTGITYWISSSIEDYNSQKDPMLKKLKDTLSPIDPRIKDIKLYAGKKSYTLNKDKIYLCLYDENGKYYEFNTCIFVLLHEISHLFNKDDIGHTAKFNEIFEDLLIRATKAGVYDPTIPPIDNYCMYNGDD